LILKATPFLFIAEGKSRESGGAVLISFSFLREEKEKQGKNIDDFNPHPHNG